MRGACCAQTAEDEGTSAGADERDDQRMIMMTRVLLLLRVGTVGVVAAIRRIAWTAHVIMIIIACRPPVGAKHLLQRRLILRYASSGRLPVGTWRRPARTRRRSRSTGRRAAAAAAIAARRNMAQNAHSRAPRASATNTRQSPHETPTLKRIRNFWHSSSKTPSMAMRNGCFPRGRRRNATSASSSVTCSYVETEKQGNGVQPDKARGRKEQRVQGFR